MKKKSLYTPKIILPGLSLVLAYLYTLKLIQPELIYHLQQPPFLSNSLFFKSYLTYPGGILEYGSTFLQQLFSIPWLGAFILTVIGAGFGFFTHQILKNYHLDKSFWFISYIPPILYLGLLANYSFPFTSAVWALATCFIIVLYIKQKSIHKNFFYSYIPLSLLMYYLVGSGFFMVFNSAVLIFHVFTAGSTRKLVPVVIILLASAIVPLVSFRFIFNLNMARAFFGFLPEMPRIIAYQQGILFALFLSFLPVILLLGNLASVINRKLEARKAEKAKAILEGTAEAEEEVKPLITPRFVFILNVFLILFISYQTYKQAHNSYMKNVVLVDYLTYGGKWEKAIEQARKEQRYNVMINFNYNRAIRKQDKLLDEFFRYPQFIGSHILYPNKISGNDIAQVSSDFYYDLGYMSEALHWAHEVQTLFPYSPRVLKRMVKANLVFGNYKAADKYLKILDDNFLSKEFTNTYSAYVRDTSLAANDPEIKRLRACIPKGCIASDAITNFTNLLKQDSHNKGAFEHLQLYFLMEHKLEAFFLNTEKGKHFYNNTSPRLFEEATIVYLLERDRSKLQKLRTSPESRKILNSYLRIMKQYKNDAKAAKADMHRQIGDSYIYYLTYYYPSAAQKNAGS